MARALLYGRPYSRVDTTSSAPVSKQRCKTKLAVTTVRAEGCLNIGAAPLPWLQGMQGKTGRQRSVILDLKRDRGLIRQACIENEFGHYYFILALFLQFSKCDLVAEACNIGAVMEGPTVRFAGGEWEKGLGCFTVSPPSLDGQGEGYGRTGHRARYTPAEL
ncbi:hypothetical protein Bbelb_443830 [Branchiostoma belcheri]|nr:hypothetical protein Bbelb_443830 [Branchiostoma belcheri]